MKDYQTQVRRIFSEAKGNSDSDVALLEAFAWCLAQLDRDEQARLRSERRLLWFYKWVINSLSEFSQVSRQQIERSFADMADRYKRAGYGLGAIHHCRAYTSIRLGDMQAHREARAFWRQAPRDGISDCTACLTDGAVGEELGACDLEGAGKY